MRIKKIFIVSFLTIFLFGGFILPFSVNAQGPACPMDVDLLFIVDTSGSMNNEWNTLCGNIGTITTDLTAMGYNMNIEIYALEVTIPADTCSTGILDQTCAGGVQGPRENWGPATGERANNYPWRPLATTTRIIMPISDEGPYCGNGCDADDTTSITNAANAADANNVFTFPLRGDTAGACPLNRMNDLVAQTAANDKRFDWAGTPADMASDIADAIVIAVGDGDGDCYIADDCPCDPADPPPATPQCPGGFLCEDEVDQEACINPGAPEELQCGPCPGVGGSICDVEYFDETNSCAINCLDTFDNDQDDYSDLNDTDCPAAGGLVPCGRTRDDASTAVDETKPCDICHIFVLVKRITDFLVEIVAFPLLVLMALAGGFLWITSAGSQSRINQGKSIIRTAVIAIIIVLVSWIVVNTLIFFLTGQETGGIAIILGGQPWNQVQCSPAEMVCP